MRRPDLEARLDALPKVTWRYERALRVDRIDLPCSKSLQYRLTDVDQDTVDRYAADMTRGDRFPALIVREVRGRLTLIGGNHRRAAATAAGIATLAAYVVVCPPDTARRIAFEDNRTHGLPLKPSERATLAARLVLLDGMTQHAAAATVGATVAQVALAVAAERAVTRAHNLGVPDRFSQLPHLATGNLGRIPDDGLFAEAARTVLDTNMGSPAVLQLCARLSAADSLEDAYDRLDAIQQARAGHTGGRGVKRNDLTRLADHCFGLLDVDPAKAAALVADGDEEVWGDRLRRTARHLMTVSQHIERQAEDAA